MIARLNDIEQREKNEINGIFEHAIETLENSNISLINFGRLSSDFRQRIANIKSKFNDFDYSQLEQFYKTVNNENTFNSYLAELTSSACSQLNQIKNIAKDFQREVVNDKHCNVKGLIDLTEFKNEVLKRSQFCQRIQHNC
jgi:hypothetical protein